jgi:3-mercaptopyruvate sulfurtransferase SseA
MILHRIHLRTFLDAFIVVLLGIVIGFSFNYARKDGLSLTKKPGGVPKQGPQTTPAPNGQTSPHTASNGNPIEPAWIDLGEAKRYFEEGTALFIDAREKEEFAEGHIAGSVNIPYGWYLEEHPDISSFIDPGKVIVTYCGGSDCEASVQLAYAMWEKGYGGIKIFFGGWQEWNSAGLPVSKGK